MDMEGKKVRWSINIADVHVFQRFEEKMLAELFYQKDDIDNFEVDSIQQEVIVMSQKDSSSYKEMVALAIDRWAANELSDDRWVSKNSSIATKKKVLSQSKSVSSTIKIPQRKISMEDMAGFSMKNSSCIMPPSEFPTPANKCPQRKASIETTDVSLNSLSPKDDDCEACLVQEYVMRMKTDDSSGCAETIALAIDRWAASESLDDRWTAERVDSTSSHLVPATTESSSAIMTRPQRNASIDSPVDAPLSSSESMSLSGNTESGATPRCSCLEMNIRANVPKYPQRRASVEMPHGSLFHDSSSSCSKHIPPCSMLSNNVDSSLAEKSFFTMKNHADCTVEVSQRQQACKFAPSHMSSKNSSSDTMATEAESESDTETDQDWLLGHDISEFDTPARE